MNLAHRWVCKSRLWRTVVQGHLIPWALENVELGATALEIGPGSGITTEPLRGLVPVLVCLEIDERCASLVEHRMAGDGVRVVVGDGAAMPLGDPRFDAVVCFTMLHHVPSAILQDALLREVIRVLRPGGVFVGTDSVASWAFRLFHVFDRVTPVNPDSFSERLQTAGFERIEVEVRQHHFRFRAHKPTGA